jgi:hypothetical protein
MSKRELEDKLKRKNLQIESQIVLLDEYRNTIKFLEAKVLRMENELSKLHQPTVSRRSEQLPNREEMDKNWETLRDCGLDKKLDKYD